jgi:hypothetical protein
MVVDNPLNNISRHRYSKIFYRHLNHQMLNELFLSYLKIRIKEIY